MGLSMTRNWELPGTKLTCIVWESSRSYGSVNLTFDDGGFVDLTVVVAKIPLLLYDGIRYDSWLHMGICADVSNIPAC